MRILFLGTPAFAVPTLQLLIDNDYEITAVVTMPDKSAGRGMRMQMSEVKKFALTKNLLLFQPEKLKDAAFLSKIKNLDIDLAIVVAFRMLPEVLWSMPRIGTMNLHGSLLPNYRGAAPINWAICHGEHTTGVSTFMLNHQIDTGNILDQTIIPLNNTINAGELHDKMMYIGAELVLHSVRKIENGNYTTIPQIVTGNEVLAPKISKENLLIDWNKTAYEVYNLIRGMSPYPAAYTIYKGKKYKIFDSKTTTIPSNKIGDWHIVNNKLFISCIDYQLEILSIQPETKKKMLTNEYLRGIK